MDAPADQNQHGRREDLRFLQGEGKFVDNIAPKDALYAHFFRSPVAHADIHSIDLSRASTLEGVHLVLGNAELRAAGVTGGLPFDVVECPDGSKGAAPKRQLLAEDRVRFVGEPIAIVVADTPALAMDACELIDFEYKVKPAKTDLSDGGATLHEEAPLNCAFDWSMGDDVACRSAFDRAEYKVRKTIRNNRVAVSTIETRGCFAEPVNDRLHVCVNGQGVDGTKNTICDLLGVDADAIRVTNPDVGGAFGMKAMSYPEPILVAFAALKLNRPVRWMADRVETMLTDTGARDLEHDAEMAFDAEFNLIGYRVQTRCNLGAYNSDLGQLIQTDYFAMVLSGAYRVQDCFLAVSGYFTNTAPTDAYRGAGRAEGMYVLERMMDYSAREMGVDPWELRRRNFIPADQFPYVSASQETIDPADFVRVLDQTVVVADKPGFAARKAASIKRGRLRGIGLSYFIMNAVGMSKVSTILEFLEDGTAALTVPSQSSGQGHETVFANFLSEKSGIPLESIEIIQGDSDKTGIGVGTGGSSSATTVANATLATVARAVEALSLIVAEKVDGKQDHVRFDGEKFRVPGSNLAPTMLEAAEWARIAGRLDLLTIEGIGTIENWAFPNGAHVAEVEVDPETGAVTLDRYSVVSDFGHLLDPQLVEGQVHGGCAQGIGQALLEDADFDSNGQLLTASFMDYAMPRAADFPYFAFANQPVMSTANPMGIKGCGEAGTVGAVPAIANAVADALRDRGIVTVDIPLTGHRVWQLLQAS